MSDQILNKTITISGVEDTGTQIKIKDENKKTYSFFKTKKDGGQTKAFESFPQYKVGDQTGIGYKEVPYKDGTIRNISFFAPPGIENSRPAPQAKAPQPAKYTPPSTEYKTLPGSRDYDKENVGKCQTVFLAAFIQSGKTFSEAKVQAVQARQLAELVVYGQQAEPSSLFPVDDAPLPQDPDEELNF